MAPQPAWLVYAGGWAFISALSWTTGAVYLVRDAGLTPLQLVLAGTALEVAYFVSEVPTGVLADLYSRRLSLVVSAFVCGLGMVLVALAEGAPAVLAGMALWGFGWTFRSGADEVGAERLGAAYQRGAQAERAGGLLGIAAAVALASAALPLPLLAAGATAGALGLVVALGMPESGFTRPDRRATGVTGSARAALATVGEGRRVVTAQPVLVIVLGSRRWWGRGARAGTGSGRRTCSSTSGCPDSSASMTWHGSACCPPGPCCSPSWSRRRS
jgi:MFS transporter, DHA3 family, tetracycline resistance protein